MGYHGDAVHHCLLLLSSPLHCIVGYLCWHSVQCLHTLTFTGNSMHLTYYWVHTKVSNTLKNLAYCFSILNSMLVWNLGCSHRELLTEKMTCGVVENKILFEGFLHCIFSCTALLIHYGDHWIALYLCAFLMCCVLRLADFLGAYSGGRKAGLVWVSVPCKVAGLTTDLILSD